MFDTRLYLCPGAIYAEVMTKVLTPISIRGYYYNDAIFSDEDDKPKA